MAQIDARWDSNRELELRHRLEQIDAQGAAYAVGQLGRLAEDWRASAGARCNGEYAPASDSPFNKAR